MQAPADLVGIRSSTLDYRMRGSAVLAIVCLLPAFGCDGYTIEDNWPTYEVRGTVRTAGGAPVAAALVEMETYGEAGCGTDPMVAYSWARTGFDGRYRVQQDEFTGV